ncbi:MAG: hypothetical protein ABW003_00575, partial [Microvirga sp.]
MNPVSLEITRIEAALDALLNEIVTRSSNEPRMPRAAQLQATPFKALSLNEIPSRIDVETDEILRDPVGAACRIAIKRLGERLYEVTKST